MPCYVCCCGVCAVQCRLKQGKTRIFGAFERGLVRHLKNPQQKLVLESAIGIGFGFLVLLVGVVLNFWDKNWFHFSLALVWLWLGICLLSSTLSLIYCL